MEASRYQAKKPGLYPEGARLVVKILARPACVCACVSRQVCMCSSTCVKEGRIGGRTHTKYLGAVERDSQTGDPHSCSFINRAEATQGRQCMTAILGMLWNVPQIELERLKTKTVCPGRRLLDRREHCT